MSAPAGARPRLSYLCDVSAPEPPVACDLGRLDDGDRRRERELLAWFRAAQLSARREVGAVRYALTADARTLAAVGELLGYERLCCPFLEFRLEVGRGKRARLTIAGGEAALDLVLAEFGGAAKER